VANFRHNQMASAIGVIDHHQSIIKLPGSAPADLSQTEKGSKFTTKTSN